MALCPLALPAIIGLLHLIHGPVKCASQATLVTSCPGGYLCLPTKYSELQINEGVCYDPATEDCCNTGEVFNVNTQQCCSVNGVQSIAEPCPCTSDAQCTGGQVNSKNTNGQCCIQTAPAPQIVSPCDPRAFFPSGSGAVSKAPGCIGRCIDKRWQICCNGASCLREYENCCNATCCNRFNAMCMPGSQVVGSLSNWWEYGVEYDRCTTLEYRDPIATFQVYILPLIILGGIVLGLCLLLALAGTVGHGVLGKLEMVMIGTAIITMMAAIPSLFLPSWKYFVIIALASFIAILAALIHKFSMYLLCVATQVILIFYLWDPITGNAYLTLASNRTAYGPDAGYAGYTVSVYGMAHIPEKCTQYYGYFQVDLAAQDTVRLVNPAVPTFGLCSRGWISAALFFSGCVLVTTMIQFAWSVVVLITRSGYLPDNPAKLPM